MAVEDVIDGVGCIARDTVQDIGSDILFLSDSGLRSLGRIIQEKSAPMRDLSRNVRDQLLAEVSVEGGIIKSTFTTRRKRSTYSPSHPYRRCGALILDQRLRMVLLGLLLGHLLT
jgi:hypothetical protein